MQVLVLALSLKPNLCIIWVLDFVAFPILISPFDSQHFTLQDNTYRLLKTHDHTPQKAFPALQLI